MSGSRNRKARSRRGSYGCEGLCGWSSARARSRPSTDMPIGDDRDREAPPLAAATAAATVEAATTISLTDNKGHTTSNSVTWTFTCT